MNTVALNAAIARLTYNAMSLQRAKLAGEFSPSSYLAYLCAETECGVDALALKLCSERRALEG